MITLPRWVLRTFDESYCPHCEKKEVKTKLDRDGVFRIGLSEELSKKTKKMRLAFFFEHKCKVCDKPSRFSGFQTNFQEFIADMIEISNSPLQDAITDNDAGQKTKTEENTMMGEKIEGISDSEIQSIKNALDETVYFEDFLDKIGITQEEREEIKKEYDNEDK